jgi:polyphosphate glucokinase
MAKIEKTDLARKARGPSRVLAIDVGGTKLKILLLGEPQARKERSGANMTPALLTERVRELAKGWKFDAVSIVGGSGPITEPGNLGPGWVGFDYAAGFGCPVRIANDAAMQALGSYDGGRMLFIGLGTGIGSTLIVERVVVPLELGELSLGNRSISETLSRAALDGAGKKKWRKAVFETVPPLQKAFLADYVVLGGGNSKHLGNTLPPGVRVGNNLTAFRGGFRLWGLDDMPKQHPPQGRKNLTSSQEEWRLL